MKNKGLIIAIGCLCVTILISVIILAVVIARNTGSTNKLAEKQLVEEEKKEKALTSEEAFVLRYGMTSTEAKNFITEQLRLTFANINLMKGDGDANFSDNELLKLKDIEEITIWRYVEASKGQNMYVYWYSINKDDIKLEIHAHQQEDYTWQFVVCLKNGFSQPYIIFECDEEGWYADRLAKVYNGVIKE